MLTKLGKYLPTSALLFFLFTGPTLALTAAQQIQEGLKKTGGEGGAGFQDTPLTVLIGNIISAMLGIIGVLFLVLMVYAGFLWMTDTGKAEQVKKAKSILTNSMIGIIIVVAAYALTSFVVDALVKASSSNQVLP